MKRIPFHWQIIIGLLLGAAWAIASSFLGWSKFTMHWIHPFGEIFIRLLKLLAVPLVLLSIISGISGLSDISKLGRWGGKTIGAYVITTIVAVTLGLLLVNVIQPGNRISEDAKISLEEVVSKQSEEAGFESLLEQKKQDADSYREGGPLRPYIDMFLTDNFFKSLTDNRLMLQVIFFAIFFGVCLSLIPSEKAAPVQAFIGGTNEVILKMISIVMKGAPFFVFALLAGQISSLAGDNPGLMFEIFKGLLWYSLTVLAGLGFLAFIFYPGLVHFFTKKATYKQFLKRINLAQSVAFSTSSSAATLPVTMDCVHKNLGVSRDMTNFVLPVGATVNMDGTSLFQAVSAVFLAQFFGVDSSLSAQITIVLMATLASIGAPAVPSAGIVMLILVLESVGLDSGWIALIFPVDRFLDMCRTAVNVTGDATVATLIGSTENEVDFSVYEKEIETS
jgi:Na+/H+-dicarboxylate symporter